MSTEAESAEQAEGARGVRGRVFDIQRFSIHDGPGIRTTVFFQGCPLRCAWCHNPEGVPSGPLLAYSPDRCIGCGYCVGVCPRDAHAMRAGRHTLDRARCVVCGQCAEGCPAGALEVIGRETAVEDVISEVVRDRAFYETSGGGMTLSGGEPTHQIDFAAALLRAAREEGLHCCVETCGACPYERLARILPDVDLFLFDWKESDAARHKELTGVSNARIRHNLQRLHEDGAAIRLRCPLIPGVNDRDGHLRGIAELADELPRLEGVQLLPYHRLGEGKLERFGLDGQGRVDAEAPPPEAVREWVARLESLGVKVLDAEG